MAVYVQVCAETQFPSSEGFQLKQNFFCLRNKISMSGLQPSNVALTAVLFSCAFTIHYNRKN